MIELETPEGIQIFINADYVMTVFPAKDRESGVPMLGISLLDMGPGTIAVKGSPKEIAELINNGRGRTAE